VFGSVCGCPPVARSARSYSYVLAVVVRRRVRVGVESDDPAVEPEVDPVLVGLAPDRVLFLALPERLRKGRARVGGVLLVADEHDRAVGVALADRLRRRVARHSTADDQIPVRHCSLLLDSNDC
jgi:hypothetical protein